MAVSPIEDYIRQAAQARGIDPDIAVRVAKSEGGLTNPTNRSLYKKGGYQEPSYGPFQLLIGGDGTNFPTGMGNQALAAGIDPRDPNQWQKGVDFALDHAKQNGWGAWYGAKAQGITGKAGIDGTPWNPGQQAAISAGAPPNAAAAAAFVKNPPPTPSTATPAPVPGTPNPGGFLSGLGSLLVSSANAGEMPSAPSLNAPMHAPQVNTADPLGVEGQSSAPLDASPAPNNPAPQQGPEQNNMGKNQFADMMTAMDQLARRSSGVAAPDNASTQAGKLSLSNILNGDFLPGKQAMDKWGQQNLPSIFGSDPTQGPAAPAAPQPQTADPQWDAAKGFLGNLFGGITPNGRFMQAAQAAGAPPTAPVQGPPMSAMTPPAAAPMQGPPMSAMLGPQQGPPMPVNQNYDDFLTRHPPTPGQPGYADFITRHPPGAPVQGPPMSAMTQYPPDPTLPDTAPVPTPNPKGKKPFDTLGFLTALGGLAGALGTGSPEVRPVSLSAPMHQPNFQGLPMPRGLL